MVSRSGRGRAWADTLLSQTLTSGAATASLNLLTTAPTEDTLTAVRMIINLNVTPTSGLEAVDGAQSVDIGIGVTSGEAFTAGAIPDPNTAGDFPARGWLWRERLVIFRGVGAGPIDTWHYPVVRADIRAARKIDKGRLFITLQLGNMTGAIFDCHVAGIIRVLCLT